MKIRPPVKIALGFLAIVGGGIYGWQLYAGLTIDKVKFAPIKPSRVNIVGIAAGSGYRILVANHAAQLVKGGTGNFSSSGGPEEEDDGGEKKRVPIREMLEAMQGDAKSLGQFIAIINNMQETAEWPSQRIIWKEEDLKKALDGDPVLKPKLEHDINVRLDGQPLKQISLTAYENGIIIETLVPCKVQVGTEVVSLKGPILVPYRPRISLAIVSQLKDKSYDLTTVAGYYALEAQKITEKKGPPEDVAKSLRNIIDPRTNEALAGPAQEILQKAFVVVTDQYIEKASFRNYKAGRDDLNDLTIEMTDEGRQRLWQYSRKRVGSQLLLIVDGVAIAAPRISHELAQGELQITQMPDKILVQDAVDAINNKNGVKS
jgi:hypothetical protein